MCLRSNLRASGRAEPGRLRHLPTVAPAGDVTLAGLALALGADLGHVLDAGLGLEALDLPLLAQAALALDRAAPQPLAVEPLATAGAVDLEASRRQPFDATARRTDAGRWARGWLVRVPRNDRGVRGGVGPPCHCQHHAACTWAVLAPSGVSRCGRRWLLLGTGRRFQANVRLS